MGKEMRRPPQQCNGNVKSKLSHLRGELCETRDSLGAAHSKIDGLTSVLQHLLLHVQQVGHGVSKIAHDVSVAKEQTNPFLLAAAHRLIGPPVQLPEPRPRQPLHIAPPLTPSVVDTWSNDTTLPEDHEDPEFRSIVPEGKKKRKRRRTACIVALALNYVCISLYVLFLAVGN